MIEDHAVVMFAKAPVPGKVKTRLAAAIGPDRAADLHRAFISDIADSVSRSESRTVLAYAGDASHEGFNYLRGLGFEFVPQPEGDLGQRMDAVLRAQAKRSATVTLIGSDSPTLNTEHLEDARTALRTRQVVLGPSFDGGYYLIGVQSSWYLDTAPAGELHPLFREIAWSTSDVLAQTLRRCGEMSCLCDLLGFWYDVDTIEDLDLLRTHLLDYLQSTGRNLAPRTTEILLRDETDRKVPDTR